MKIGFQCMPAQDWTAFQWMTSLGRKMKTYFLHMKESESIALGAFLPSSTRYFIEWRHIYVAANLFMKCFAIRLHILHPASSEIWLSMHWVKSLGRVTWWISVVRKIWNSRSFFASFVCVVLNVFRSCYLRKWLCMFEFISESTFDSTYWVLVSCFVKLDKKLLV